MDEFYFNRSKNRNHNFVTLWYLLPILFVGRQVVDLLQSPFGVVLLELPVLTVSPKYANANVYVLLFRSEEQ